MGNSDTKLALRKAVIQLTSKTQVISDSENVFWDQFWSESTSSAQDFFALIPASEIRKLRDEVPQNLATLCHKAVEKLVQSVDSSCRTQHDQITALNCCRLLVRILPYILEHPNWKDFFWSHTPVNNLKETNPLAESLLNAIFDLLFCPDFTVTTGQKALTDTEELASIDSCEYIWEPGVGFAHSQPKNSIFFSNRTELLKVLLTCFGETMYVNSDDSADFVNKWIQYTTSSENRHALPMFTSLLNTVCAYDPIGYGVPYNHLIFADSTEPLVDISLQILIVSLDHDTCISNKNGKDKIGDNLFINYLSRIHRDEDFSFILKGITRLMNNPLLQTYLPNSTKKVQFHQELLVFFWKICDYNKKFLYFVLKSSDVLEVLVPILFYLNDSRADQSKVGLMHIGVFILLLLSGERNFGVRLNKPYTATVPMDIPVFTGTHADLLVIVFHKIITTGHQRLQPLFDCLLTILVNVSPYLKTLSMVASTKLLHLLEAFSTPWFLFSAPNNHHLVFFLLEIFNNIIQYQFDGNSNLVYTIIRKRQVFHSLVNLPVDCNLLIKSVEKTSFREESSPKCFDELLETSMEGARPAAPAEPGTLKTSLLKIPDVGIMTEKKSAHCINNSKDKILNEATNELNINTHPSSHIKKINDPPKQSILSITNDEWVPTIDWINQWKSKLPLQTIMRLLQVLVPQVEKICIDKSLTDEGEILKFLQHGTLVGLLPVPHPILIRRYQANTGTSAWFRTYMWGVIYLRNIEPPIC
ncbi:protein HID1 isoform X2 [Trichogramma pretiosum]|uniref:protein HID1 isoform X2 n=1 Tax=Trichogramma pretiosum TaxID=7493 RepID=UPI0006C988F9|nr:protein HID1 isoform X2 [Trichogramma pretiosum]